MAYRDDVFAAAKVAEIIEGAVERWEPVLVCLPERLDALIRPLVDSDRVVFRPVGDRYQRPIDAMEQLWRFVCEQLAGGVRSVWSIGEIPVAPGDERAWVWYEHAVNDVLGDLPLHAVCLLDTRRLDGALLERMLAAHRSDAVTPPMPVLDPPAAVATRVFETDACHDARAVVAGLGRALGARARETAQLIVSELVSNAVRHGRSPATVSLWVDEGELVIEVVDRGDGIRDHSAALRPPRIPHHGAGLWICHRLAEAFSVAATADGGTRAQARIAV